MEAGLKHKKAVKRKVLPKIAKKSTDSQDSFGGNEHKKAFEQLLKDAVLEFAGKKK